MTGGSRVRSLGPDACTLLVMGTEASGCPIDGKVISRSKIGTLAVAGSEVDGADSR